MQKLSEITVHLNAGQLFLIGLFLLALLLIASVGVLNISAALKLYFKRHNHSRKYGRTL